MSEMTGCLVISSSFATKTQFSFDCSKAKLLSMKTIKYFVKLLVGIIIIVDWEQI